MADAFTAGQKLTASFLNGLFKGSAGWEPYTPVWGSNTGTPPAIGNGSMVGAYAKAGRICLARVYMAAGSTSTFGSAGIVYTWSLPFAFSWMWGIAELVDTSAGLRASRFGFALSGTTFGLHSEGGTYVGPASPWTWANTDTMQILMIGESAS